MTFSQETTDLQAEIKDLRHELDQIKKGIDDLLWFERVSDICYIDKINYTGPALRAKPEDNPTAQGYGNPIELSAYVFIPFQTKEGEKLPLLVLPHGGVHSNFNTFYTHIIRELMFQGYVVVAPEYRGSSGYGRGFYESIDYGGLETEDVHAARAYMIENYTLVDATRVGILGWSHGGLITLLTIFDHPQEYQAAFAGVPVSDLVARMGYKDQAYRDLFSASFHLGKTADEDVAEYKKRSPAWQGHRLSTPLLIHTNTNDEDVNVLEVEHLIKSLKAEGKKFDYEVFQNQPGGHVFDRIDTRQAQEARLKIYAFLSKRLQPSQTLKNIKALRKAAYRFDKTTGLAASRG
ncbi:MAG: S9 family peptidase [Cytophagales bacterium]|nr:S9 family peptidase [Cytophagales bacterium]